MRTFESIFDEILSEVGRMIEIDSGAPSVSEFVQLRVSVGEARETLRMTTLALNVPHVRQVRLPSVVFDVAGVAGKRPVLLAA